MYFLLISILQINTKSKVAVESSFFSDWIRFLSSPFKVFQMKMKYWDWCLVVVVVRQCDAELECEAVRAMLCQLYNRFCMRYACSLTIALLTRLVQFWLLFFMFYKRAYQFVLQNFIFKIWKFFFASQR